MLENELATMVNIDPEFVRTVGWGIAKGSALLGAGLCMGIGAVGPAVGECYAAAKAIECMGRNPQQQGMMLRNMLIAMAVGETTAIYSLVISLLLIFVA